MDEQKKDDQQVEDLELKEEEAEEVKGGFSWGASQTAKPTESLSPMDPLIQRGGWDGNHSEILVVI